MPIFTPIIAELPSTTPFVGPEALTRRTGKNITARIGANESVFGPSPKVIKAMQLAAMESWAYCDPEHFDLKAAIAAHVGVKPENIACGEGIDGLLGLVVRLFVSPGDVVATLMPRRTAPVTSHIPYSWKRSPTFGIAMPVRAQLTDVVPL